MTTTCPVNSPGASTTSRKRAGWRGILRNVWSDGGESGRIASDKETSQHLVMKLAYLPEPILRVEVSEATTCRLHERPGQSQESLSTSCARPRWTAGALG